MEKEKTFAYSEALALESSGGLGDYDQESNTYNNITSKDLGDYARIVAYKVAHNLENGFEMDKTINPLKY